MTGTSPKIIFPIARLSAPTGANTRPCAGNTKVPGSNNRKQVETGSFEWEMVKILSVKHVTESCSLVYRGPWAH